MCQHNLHDATPLVLQSCQVLLLHRAAAWPNRNQQSSIMLLLLRASLYARQLSRAAEEV